MDSQFQGPYFKGQKASPCGHYYPDVIRVRDEMVNGQPVRILDCKHCGRYSREIQQNMFSREQIDDGQVSSVRESALKELLERQ